MTSSGVFQVPSQQTTKRFFAMTFLLDVARAQHAEYNTDLKGIHGAIQPPILERCMSIPNLDTGRVILGLTIADCLLQAAISYLEITADSMIERIHFLI